MATSAAEVEEAFEHYIAVQKVQDWDVFCDLFTEDAVYVEHEFGTFSGKDALRAWLIPTMAPLNAAGWTYPLDWHLVDGNRVVFRWWNRLPNPDGRDEPYQFGGITVLEYAGDGLWSFEEDIYNMKECEQVLADWVAAGGHIDLPPS